MVGLTSTPFLEKSAEFLCTNQYTIQRLLFFICKTILGVGAMMKVTYFDILLEHQFAGHSLQQYSTGSLCFIGLSPSLCKRHSFGLEHVHGTWNKVVQIHNCAIWIDVSRMLSLNMHTHSLCEVQVSSVHNNQEVKHEESWAFIFCFSIMYRSKHIDFIEFKIDMKL